MHGNVNEICARLLDSFDPQQRISLLIWTAEDVHDCTSDMNLTDDEAEAVLAEIAECSSHSRYGVGKDTVWSLAKQVREDAARDRKIEVNAEALQKVVALAAQFIRFSKGLRASRRWQVPGAREEAQCGFPHITRLALPQLQHSRARGASEPQAQLDALMAIMTSLSDTCVLSRAGMAGLQAMQQGACEVLAAGGCASFAGRAALARLDAIMLALNASPGGAADLLAATLFLDRVAG
ncbi:TPA: DUF1380 domain-containing protein [Klebsiella pneumoniae]|nr:DUF1380 domain-containing protein [Klebsiella pneumoniae]